MFVLFLWVLVWIVIVFERDCSIWLVLRDLGVGVRFRCGRLFVVDGLVGLCVLELGVMVGVDVLVLGVFVCLVE